jgi:hypothetical protein
MKGYRGSVCDFIEASRTLFLIFCKKRQTNIVKTVSTHTKSTGMIYETIKKYSSRDTVLLKFKFSASLRDCMREP